MQITFVMLIFLLFSHQISGGEVFGEEKSSGRRGGKLPLGTIYGNWVSKFSMSGKEKHDRNAPYLSLWSVFWRKKYLNLKYLLLLSSRTPDFYEEVKIKLPPNLNEQHHLLFTFYHISFKSENQGPTEPIPVGYTVSMMSSLHPILTCFRKFCVIAPLQWQTVFCSVVIRFCWQCMHWQDLKWKITVSKTESTAGSAASPLWVSQAVLTITDW